ncbi:MAG: hypothetical protein WA199_06665, partial [Xanthobacteraceae bacterium]
HKLAKPAKRKPAAAKLDGKGHDGKPSDGRAEATPWTPMSASALAASPPAELKADAPGAAQPKPVAAQIRE